MITKSKVERNKHRKINRLDLLRKSFQKASNHNIIQQEDEQVKIILIQPQERQSKESDEWISADEHDVAN